MGQGAAVVIGNFDGFHRGHAGLVHGLVQGAHARSLRPVVITFDPHPRRVFEPLSSPFQLTSVVDRSAFLRDCGVVHELCLRFDDDLRSMEAEDFIRDVLIEQLGTERVLGGPDLRVGRDRRGDAAMMRALGIDVDHPPMILDAAGEVISSTRIRSLLLAGDVVGATDLLGRPYRITGQAEAGLQQGRRLGFPTINVDLGTAQAPAVGVYVGLACLPAMSDEPEVFGPALAHYGKRTIFGNERLVLEVYFLSFPPDTTPCYGRELSFSFLKFIRPSVDYSGDNRQEGALMAQMREDLARAEAYVQEHLQEHVRAGFRVNL